MELKDYRGLLRKLKSFDEKISNQVKANIVRGFTYDGITYNLGRIADKLEMIFIIAIPVATYLGLKDCKQTYNDSVRNTSIEFRQNYHNPKR